MSQLDFASDHPRRRRPAPTPVGRPSVGRIAVGVFLGLLLFAAAGGVARWLWGRATEPGTAAQELSRQTRGIEREQKALEAAKDEQDRAETARLWWQAELEIEQAKTALSMAPAADREAALKAYQAVLAEQRSRQFKLEGEARTRWHKHPRDL